MLATTHAIVLRKFPYGETSLVVHAYTQDFGLQSFIVGGVRKPNARAKASAFSPLAELELVFYYKEKNEMHRLKEFRAARLNHGMAGHYIKSGLALFVAEFLHKTLKTQIADEETFSFLQEQIELLDKSERLATFPLNFLYQYSKILGISPQWPPSPVPLYFDLLNGRFTGALPTHPNVIKGDDTQWFAATFAPNACAQLTRQQRNAALEHWILFFRVHHEGLGEINSVQVLREVFG